MQLTEKISPLQAWNIATSVKLHFEGKLDAVKYRYSMKSLTAKAFETRKDKYYFEKLARKHSTLQECVWYCASNVMDGNKWIGSMCEEPYDNLSAWHQSMDYRFAEEMKAFAATGETFDALLMDLTLTGKPPRLIQFIAAEKTSVHAGAIIQCLTNFIDREMGKVIDPLSMWEEHARRLRAYGKILETNLNRGVMKAIILKAFNVE